MIIQINEGLDSDVIFNFAGSVAKLEPVYFLSRSCLNPLFQSLNLAFLKLLSFIWI